MKEFIRGEHIEELSVIMHDDRFEREKAYIEQQKKRFEFVERHENYDLYRHKTKGFHECFPNYYL